MNVKNNAKPNIGLPAKIPVNAGTASPATPANLGVPTPPLPYDPAAAGGGPGMAPTGPGAPVAPGSAPFDPQAALSALGPSAGQRDPFLPSDDIVQQVRGMIHNWHKEELKNLITYAAHLLTLDKEKKPDSKPGK